MGFMTRNVTQTWIGWDMHSLLFKACEVPGRFSYCFQKKPQYTTLWLFAWGINFYCIIFTFRSFSTVCFRNFTFCGTETKWLCGKFPVFSLVADVERKDKQKVYIELLWLWRVIKVEKLRKVWKHQLTSANAIQFVENIHKTEWII